MEWHREKVGHGARAPPSLDKEVLSGYSLRGEPLAFCWPLKATVGLGAEEAYRDHSRAALAYFPGPTEAFLPPVQA